MIGRPMGGKVVLNVDLLPEAGNAAQFAKALGVSSQIISIWVKAGAPASREHNGRVFLQREPFVAWLKETGRAV